MTPRMMADLTKDMTDAQKTQFFIDNRDKLFEMAKRIVIPGTQEQLESVEVHSEKDITWCNQNPDPGLEPGDLVKIKGEHITVTAVNRHPDGRRDYEILRNGILIWASAEFVEGSPK